MTAPRDVSLAFGSSEQWSATAQQYRQQSKTGVTQPVSDLVVSVAHSLLPFSQATAIFDDGCGTGQVMETVLRAHGASIPSSARLLAGDFSSGMVAIVEELKAENAAADPVWSRLETQVVDAMDLVGIADASLSHIVSSLCIYGLPDVRKALRECRRVLAPGGVLSLSGLGETPWFDMLEGADSIRPHQAHSVGFNFPPEFKTAQNLTALLESEGFKDVKAETVEMPMALPDKPSDFYKKFLRGNNPAIVSQFQGWTGDELDSAAEHAERNIRKKYGEGPVTLIGIGVIAGGRK